AFTVTTNALFQADGVEVYDSDCDDVPNTQLSFMANISSFGLDVLSEGRQISVAVGTTKTYTPRASGSNSRKQRIVICYNCKWKGYMSKQCTKPKRKRDDSWFKDKVLQVQDQVNDQILHEEELAFLADPGIAKVALMANLSYYGSDVLAEVQNPDNSDMIHQGVQVMLPSEQSSVASAHNSNSSAQQDALILSMIEQLKTQVIHYTKINLDNKNINDTLTAKLEIYKEQVKVLKEGQNVEIKKKESLMKTVTVFKDDFKKEESRNIDREIALEKKIKHLDNIVYKRDQSAQTVHFNVIKNTSAIVIPDSEETLILVEESHPSPSCTPNKVEVLKELPKVSMVNTSLKKLKNHLDGFDMVVKERTTATAIIEDPSLLSCTPNKVEVFTPP
ncbi:hypothetical protein Tco_0945402, partial [Tanacetum coccineum]